MIAAFNNGSRNRRIFVSDKTSKIAFLIDTGADVSVFPRKRVTGQTRKCEYELYAANSTRIRHTNDTMAVDLDFSLRRTFKSQMTVTDVDTPIIGMNFLIFYGLLVDQKNGRLLDSETGLTTHSRIASGRYASVRTIVGNTNYHKILADFLELTRPVVFGKEPAKHDVKHHPTVEESLGFTLAHGFQEGQRGATLRGLPCSQYTHNCEQISCLSHRRLRQDPTRTYSVFHNRFGKSL